jgi:hypothetical protein
MPEPAHENFHAAAVIALLAGPALAQTQSIPKYGETPKEKSAQELAAERTLRSVQEIARQHSEQSFRPLGRRAQRSAPKTVAKDPAAKRTKAGNTAN